MEDLPGLAKSPALKWDFELPHVDCPKCTVAIAGDIALVAYNEQNAKLYKRSNESWVMYHPKEIYGDKADSMSIADMLSSRPRIDAVLNQLYSKYIDAIMAKDELRYESEASGDE